jgi:hypothetical protein
VLDDELDDEDEDEDDELDDELDVSLLLLTTMSSKFNFLFELVITNDNLLKLYFNPL